VAQKALGEEEESKTEPGGTFKRQEKNTEEGRKRQEGNQEYVLEKAKVYKGGGYQ